ncbi:hypothetical protein [Leucothrix pacifica]|uniref:Autotransporter domain-containing protein n=1 Tax=Leucothrix pacifica TaxID=1247513 RepID=A0A317C622_9GAMM|nr:hypothetical protein [Leucothrix pacifica]PWQ94058.1 hypothetical protein DKW60_17295 [Leucothrix pacifica]
MVLRSRIVKAAASKGRFLLIPACFAVAFSATANEIELPLLKDAKALQCATSEPAAKAALSRFWDVQGDDLPTPVEEGRALQSGTLHAATMDIILNTLVDTAERFPSLRNQVERTMLQWDYCEVFKDGVFYDVSHSDGHTDRTKVLYDSPEAWKGFKRLGFLGETEQRFIPDIISSDQLSLRADFEQLFHRIYREQCFPHPDTSELFDITEFGLDDKLSATVTDENDVYPHNWESECLYPMDVPLLKTQLRLEDVPVEVPELISSVKLQDLPQLVPRLATSVELMPVAQLVSGLATKVDIQPVQLAVPSLESRLEIVPVPQAVPQLVTSVDIVPVALDVPELLSTVEILPVPLEVPLLKTTLDIVPVEVDIPVLQTSVEIIEQALNVPVLISSVEFDQAKPKVFTKPAAKPLPKPVVVASARGGIGGVGGYGGGYAGGAVTTVAPQPVVVQPTVVAPKPVAVQPVVQQVVAPRQVIQKPTTVVIDKDASLLERLLSGLNSGSNVLVIDKIQLTVNEYNGNVETAISSSDVGTSSVAPALDSAALIKELVKFNSQKTQPAVQPIVEKKVPYVEKKAVKKKTYAQPSKSTKPKLSKPQHVSVPRLESILLVSPVIVRTPPKKVVISKPKTSSVNVPKLKTQLSVKPKPKSKPKTYKAPKKTYKAPKKKASRDTSGSSVFVYQPYKSGDKPSANEKSVEQLLQEYADYEARRKSGRSSKKKLNEKKARPSEPISKNSAKPVSKSSSVNIMPKKVVKVDASDSTKQQSKLSSQKTAKKKSPAVKEPEVILAKKAPTPKEEVAFTFADEAPDYADVKQVSVATTNTPSGLSLDAPLPYVIEENFINDQLSDDEIKAKKAKTKKPVKKPIGLAGNVYLKNSLGSDKWGIGGSINRKLIKDDYYFARVGWSYSLEDEEEPFSYSWGIGYSDWHAGTFSAQLNNWGPIKPGEGLALDKAIASFGYSVKSDLLKKYRLSLSGAINVPIDGNTSAAVNMRWSPIENWYINASVSQPLEGDGDPKWSYGFGYSDWRPNKFNLQYSNYGPNDLFYHNYRTNGTWSLSYNYKF